jgi:hypothetical protein
VDGRGKAVPPAVPPAEPSGVSSRGQGTTPAGEDPEEIAHEFAAAGKAAWDGAHGGELPTAIVNTQSFAG